MCRSCPLFIARQRRASSDRKREKDKSRPFLSFAAFAFARFDASTQPSTTSDGGRCVRFPFDCRFRIISSVAGRPSMSKREFDIEFVEVVSEEGGLSGGRKTKPPVPSYPTTAVIQ